VHPTTEYRNRFLKALADIVSELEKAEPDNVANPVAVDAVRARVEPLPGGLGHIACPAEPVPSPSA
jgi:hypothetical protein